MRAVYGHRVADWEKEVSPHLQRGPLPCESQGADAEPAWECQLEVALKVSWSQGLVFWDEKTPGTGACIKEMLENQKLRGTRSSWLKRGAAKGDGWQSEGSRRPPKEHPWKNSQGKRSALNPTYKCQVQRLPSNSLPEQALVSLQPHPCTYFEMGSRHLQEGSQRERCPLHLLPPAARSSLTPGSR